MTAKRTRHRTRQRRLIQPPPDPFVADMSSAQLEKSLAAADPCFQHRKLKSGAARARVLDKAATQLCRHVDDFARLETLEMGKRIDEARGEVRFSADILAYYARHAEALLAPDKLHPKLGEAHMESSPLGALFCVEPWNFPYYQLARIAGPQLMAGNVLLVKHAGYGRQLGAMGIQEFVNKKLVRSACIPAPG